MASESLGDQAVEGKPGGYVVTRDHKYYMMTEGMPVKPVLANGHLPLLPESRQGR